MSYPPCIHDTPGVAGGARGTRFARRGKIAELLGVAVGELRVRKRRLQCDGEQGGHASLGPVALRRIGRVATRGARREDLPFAPMATARRGVDPVVPAIAIVEVDEVR